MKTLRFFALIKHGDAFVLKPSEPCTMHRECFGEIWIKATKFQLQTRRPLSHETKTRRRFSHVKKQNSFQTNICNRQTNERRLRSRCKWKCELKPKLSDPKRAETETESFHPAERKTRGLCESESWRRNGESETRTSCKQGELSVTVQKKKTRF